MAEIAYKRLAKKRRKKKILIITCIVLAALVLLAGIYLLCTVRHVEVVGNENYSAEQIRQDVIPSGLGANTLYLLFQIKRGALETPPYLDLAEVELVSFDSVRIRVYERTIMAGAAAANGYVYFDQDGVALEITAEQKENVPLISGLEFEEVKQYETLQVTDESVFQSLVNLMQLLEKNELVPDSIAVTDGDKFDVTFADVTVHLGQDDAMDNKIARLASIMTTLSGKSGELDMEDVDEDTDRITFTKKKTQAEIDAETQAEEQSEEQTVYDEAYQQALWDAEWAEANGEEYDWDAFYEQYGSGSDSTDSADSADSTDSTDSADSTDSTTGDSAYDEAYQQALWDAEWAEENGEEYDWDAFYEEYGTGE